MSIFGISTMAGVLDVVAPFMAKFGKAFNVHIPGSLTVGSDGISPAAGSIGGIFVKEFTWDIGNIASGNQDATVQAWTGLTRDDACIVAVDSVDDFWHCTAKADTDEVQIRCTNYSGGLLNPSSGTATVTCFRKA